MFIILAMKSDRKRLKAEKIELLGQMKQLYSTLQDKESELREFIRNYEQRMKDCDTSIKQVLEHLIRVLDMCVNIWYDNETHLLTSDTSIRHVC